MKWLLCRIGWKAYRPTTFNEFKELVARRRCAAGQVSLSSTKPKAERYTITFCATSQKGHQVIYSTTQTGPATTIVSYTDLMIRRLRRDCSNITWHDEDLQLLKASGAIAA